MKKITMLLLLVSTMAIGQISVTSIKKESPAVKVYDSTYNFPGNDIEVLIGQDVFVKPLSESLRKYGYSNFGIDKSKREYEANNIYEKIKNGSKTEYNALAERSFYVKNVFDADSHNPILELVDSKKNVTIYFYYSKTSESSFPFIVQGFFDKLKVKSKGKYVLRTLDEYTDLSTNTKINHSVGDLVEITDVTLDDVYYAISYLVKNENGNTFLTSGYWIRNKVFSNSKFELMKSLYPDHYDSILRGTVEIGMTDDAVVFSWGNPKKKNISSHQEQWVYDGKYLYFKEGKLTSFN